MRQHNRDVRVGHSWRPFADLPDDSYLLADAGLRRLAGLIERVHEYCPPEQVASEMDRLLADPGNLRPLVRLFAGIQRRAFERAIKIAHDAAAG